jgi:hypothetical protein
MRTAQQTAELGELVVAAFDEATRYSTDPREVSRLATRAVMDIVRRARRTSHEEHVIVRKEDVLAVLEK